MDDPMKR